MIRSFAKILNLYLIFIIVLSSYPALAADDLQSYRNCQDTCYNNYGSNRTDDALLTTCLSNCNSSFPTGSQICNSSGTNIECVGIDSRQPKTTIPVTPCVPSATHFCLNIPIGRLTGFEISSANTIMGDYIKSWYGFLLGTVGILATIMIMWGGFKYLVSRGDKASIESAKTQMISAVTGIVLAFGTYTLLYLINPALLTINTPNLPNIQGGENITLKQGGSGDTNIDFNKVPQTGITDYGGITDKTSAAINSYKQKYGAIPTSTYRPGPDDDRHSSGRAVDFHLQEGSQLYNHVTAPENWSQNPQQLSWGTAYYLNDGSVWVDEPGGTARHFHTEIPDEGWVFCPNWPCK